MKQLKIFFTTVISSFLISASAIVFATTQPVNMWGGAGVTSYVKCTVNTKLNRPIVVLTENEKSCQRLGGKVLHIIKPDR